MMKTAGRYDRQISDFRFEMSGLKLFCPILLLALSSMILALYSIVTATEIIEYKGIQTIRLSVGQATSIEMPSEITTFITGIDQNLLSMEYSGKRVYLQPLSLISGDLYVVTRDNRQYVFSLIIVPPEQRHKEIRLVSHVIGAKERIEKLRALTPLGLIKSMTNNEVPEGVEVSEGGFILYKDEDFTVKALKVYNAMSLQGLVIEIVRKEGSIKPFPIKDYYLEGIIAISLKDKFLKGGATHGYIVRYNQ
ncbi:MAG: type-F conjugative transfer system secretin TraK [Nitrospirota bacterium]